LILLANHLLRDMALHAAFGAICESLCGGNKPWHTV
jgi:hypothetical protein